MLKDLLFNFWSICISNFLADAFGVLILHVLHIFVID